MSAIQTRRAVSVTNATYRKLVLYCEINNLSMSSVVEEVIKKAVGGTWKLAARKPEQPDVHAAWRDRRGLSYRKHEAEKAGRAAPVAR